MKKIRGVQIFSRYPRQFRNKIVYNERDLEEYIKLFNGMGLCWLSLYSFTEIIDRKPEYTSAVVDCLLVELDYDNAKKLDHLLKGDKTPHVNIFDGDKFNIIIPFNKRVDDLKKIAIDFKKELEEYKIKGRVNYFLNKKILCPGTLNLKTNLFVLLVEDFLPLEEIKRRASLDVFTKTSPSQ